MKIRLLIILVIAAVLAVACQSADPVAPTPFPTSAATQSGALSGQISLTVPELANAPGVYQDQVVTLTGQLHRQPLLICEGEINQSPGTWSLVDEGTSFLASGFDQQVRSLLPDGLAMTVEGRVRRWQGPVGCGKQAQNQDLWLVEVNRVLSPSPLTMVTLTPDGQEAAEVTEVTPVVGVDVQATDTITTGQTVPVDPVVTAPAGGYPGPEATTDLQATPGSATAGPVETAVISDTTGVEITPTIAGQTASVTPVGTTTATVGAGTATPTLASNVTTGTPDPSGNPTPSSGLATPTVGAGDVVQMGDLFDTDEEFAADILRAGQAHNWTFEVFEGDIPSISAVAAAPANLMLSISKDGQTIIDRQNTAAAGETETLDKPTLQGPGVYDVRVENVTGGEADYVMALFLDGDFEIVLNGIIEPGETKTDLQVPLDGTHYWNFVGSAGETVTITVVPDAAGDVYVDLYGPGAIYLETGDDGFEGEEEIFTYTLPNSGLHSIAISEIDFNAMGYSISLQK